MATETPHPDPLAADAGRGSSSFVPLAPMKWGRGSGEGVSATRLGALAGFVNLDWSSCLRGGIIPNHFASWKMIPIVKRSPERRRLTPWRMVTR
jgi:hypothetical protein